MELISKSELLRSLESDILTDAQSLIFDTVHKYVYSKDDEMNIERLRTLPECYQIIFDSIVIEGEVYNGGFSQYYTNPTARDHHIQGIDALRKLRAFEMAVIFDRTFDLLKEKCAGFKDSYLNEGIQLAYEKYCDSPGENLELNEFRECENKFDKLNQSVENLNELRFQYIKNHVDSF
jgi:hypothetical protein